MEAITDNKNLEVGEVYVDVPTVILATPLKFVKRTGKGIFFEPAGSDDGGYAFEEDGTIGFYIKDHQWWKPTQEELEQILK